MNLFMSLETNDEGIVAFFILFIQAKRTKGYEDIF